MRFHRFRIWIIVLCCHAAGVSSAVYAQTLPPKSISANDHPWDDGTRIDVTLEIDRNAAGTEYLFQKCAEPTGLYETVEQRTPTDKELRKGLLTVTSDKHNRGDPYWFRAAAIQMHDGSFKRSAWITMDEDQPAVATRQLFDGSRFWLLVISSLVCGSVLLFIQLARLGANLKVRPIAGLEAIEEAVGRATEMGSACLFVPGIMDMNDMQTIAGLTILSKVAEQAAEYDCILETPTARSLVMTAARETVATAFLKAGRPEAYNDDLIYYVTDEQFAYVSFLTGKMVREKPAACFYLGAFYAESLILAETGNSIGAIQVAGTAMPSQLPFFVAACDYTLIGEEFFAASAYLSGDPDQLGSLKGQDVGKIIVGGLILLGVLLVTIVEVAPGLTPIADAADYLMNTVLSGQ